MHSMREWLDSLGFYYLNPILDGQVHRFNPEGRKDKCGWYIGSETILSGGRVAESITVGDFSVGLKESYYSPADRNGAGFTPEDLAKIRRAQQDAVKAAELEKAEKYAEGAELAAMTWDDASHLGNNLFHEYLARKKISFEACKNIRCSEDDKLLIPIKELDGKLVGLQTISEDGTKKYTPGTKKKGCGFLFGEIDDKTKAVGVCEGFATGASLFDCLGMPIFVAFDAGNLSDAGKAIRDKFPSVAITFYADNDIYGEVNTGLEAAIKAAKLVGGSVEIPKFKDLSSKPTDFNDLFCLEGALLSERVEIKDIHEEMDEKEKEIKKVGGKSRYMVLKALESLLQSGGLNKDEGKEINKLLKRMFYIDDAPVTLAKEFIKWLGLVTKSGDCLLRYYRNDFYRYKDGSYQLLETDWILERINRFLVESEYPRLAGPKMQKDIISNLICRPVFVGSQIELPAYNHSESWMGDWVESKHLIPVSNGVLNLKTRELISKTPRYFSLYGLEFPYDPNAKCPLFDKLCAEVFSSPEEVLMWGEIMGVHIYSPFLIEKMFLLYGQGANGKSVLTTILACLLGQKNVSSVSIDCFNSVNFNFHSTLGKLANIIPDMKEINSVDEGALKAFISREEMLFNRKGKPAIKAKPTAYVTACTNNLPKFNDKTDGIWRRIILVEFKKQFKQEDQNPQFRDPDFWIKSGELPGILNKAIAGADRVIKRGYILETEESRDAVKEYREDLSHVAQFVEDCLEFGSFRVPSHPVYRAFEQMVRQNGGKVCGNRLFFKQVRDIAKSKSLDAYVGKKTEKKDSYIGKMFYGARLNEYGERLSVEIPC